MQRFLLAATLAAALTPTAGVLAQSEQQPAPQPQVRPAEMADSWLLQSQGHTLCTLRLSARAHANGVFGAKDPGDCVAPAPSGVAGWRPTGKGVDLIGANGATVVSFRRWSESLFVASGPGAPDLQLSRAPAEVSAR
jgi:hypothetical protein